MCCHPEDLLRGPDLVPWIIDTIDVMGEELGVIWLGDDNVM